MLITAGRGGGIETPPRTTPQETTPSTLRPNLSGFRAAKGRRNVAYTGAILDKHIGVLRKLPAGTFFDTTKTGFEFQAHTQAQAKELRKHLPHCIWHKHYEDGCKWWEYTANAKGLTMRIYAIDEAPATCKAIYKEQTVQEQVPVAFETRTVRKQVLVGWDCGKGKK